MPVTILLKAIGLIPVHPGENFFVNDNFRLMDSGAQMEFVPERLRGEVARFDITDKVARSSSPGQARITARHTRTGAVRQDPHQVPELFLIVVSSPATLWTATPAKSSPRPTRNSRKPC